MSPTHEPRSSGDRGMEFEVFDPQTGQWQTVKTPPTRSEEHTSELQSQSNLVCRLLLEKKTDHCVDPGARPLVRVRAGVDACSFRDGSPATRLPIVSDAVVRVAVVPAWAVGRAAALRLR